MDTEEYTEMQERASRTDVVGKSGRAASWQGEHGGQGRYGPVRDGSVQARGIYNLVAGSGAEIT